MLLQINYLIRSKLDGKYLVARMPEQSGIEASYLLVFQQDYDALSYINAHGQEFCDRAGFGIVKDPLLPEIQFVS